jgi:hypothetical protein
MRWLQLQKPTTSELTLWGALCLLPLLVVFAATSDLWIEPRTVLGGVIASKSFEPESRGYGTMFFNLRGQPYRFSAPLRIVRPISGPRPESSYDAVVEGRWAAVTVLARDLPATAGPGTGSTVPVILVEQDGGVVFRSGRLILALIFIPALVLLALMGLLGSAIAWHKFPIVVYLGRSRVLLGFDRLARHFAQMLFPTRHAQALTMARFMVAFSVFWLLCALAVIIYLATATLQTP